MSRLAPLALCVVSAFVLTGCDRKPQQSPAGGRPNPSWMAEKEPTEAQQQAFRSGANLRQIGQAMLLYENAHAGKSPTKLEELIQDPGLQAEALKNPRPGFEYVWTGKPVSKSTRGTVIAYERGPTEDVNILFAGGGVLKYRAEDAKRIIAEGKGKPAELP
jgi:hypothetical protein